MQDVVASAIFLCHMLEGSLESFCKLCAFAFSGGQFNDEADLAHCGLQLFGVETISTSQKLVGEVRPRTN